MPTLNASIAPSTMGKYSGYLALVLFIIGLLTLSYPGYLLAKATLSQVLLKHAWQQAYLQENELASNNFSAYFESNARFNFANRANFDNNASSLPDQKVKPWPWADIYPVAKLIDQKNSQQYIVLNNDSGNALAFGPGLHGISARQNQQVIISGHNDSHFDWLKAVELDDKLTLTRLAYGTTYYQVTDKVIVDLRTENITLEHIDRENYQGENKATNTVNKQLLLITCYPFNNAEGNTPYRLLVYAQAVE